MDLQLVHITEVQNSAVRLRDLKKGEFFQLDNGQKTVYMVVQGSNARGVRASDDKRYIFFVCLDTGQLVDTAVKDTRINAHTPVVRLDPARFEFYREAR